MEKEITELRLIEDNLKSVIDNQLFQIVMQPIFLADGNQKVGYEALTRFTGASYQSPSECFYDAKRVDLYHQLEQVVILAALDKLKYVQDDCYLSINISPLTLVRGVLGEVLRDISLERVVLELTEHDPVLDYELLNEILEPFRKSGLRLAVDDVGAGYSSFWHVLQLKPDIVKIDAKFINGIDGDQKKQWFVKFLVDFCSNTDCKVLAEGVETEAELTVLSRLKVDLIQGFLLGRPSSIFGDSEIVYCAN